jgi:transposase
VGSKCRIVYDKFHMQHANEAIDEVRRKVFPQGRPYAGTAYRMQIDFLLFAQASGHVSSHGLLG